MVNCVDYPRAICELNKIDAHYQETLSEEELEHLQRVAALNREARMNRSGLGDLCQSDLD